MARDLTKGSISRHIIYLAVPSVLSMFAIVVNNIIDTALVGHLGEAELAAVGSAGYVVWIIFSLMDLFSIGTVALVSRSFGAKDLNRASEISLDIMRFVFLFSFALVFAGILFSKNIFGFLNLAPEVEKMGATYLRIVFLSVPALFLGEIAAAVFRSIGDSKTPMIIMISSVAFNIVLDICLIYGVWIFPRLETMGAALATVLAHTASLGIGLIFVLKGRIPFNIIPRRILPIDFRVVAKLTKIGLPISLASIIFSVVYMALTRIMSEFGTAAVAAIPVGHRSESISFMTCFGFYMATSAIVGQNLGAGDAKRARKTAWTSVGIVSIITFIFGLVFFVFARQITSIFTNELKVVEIATLYLKIIALSQVFIGFEMIFEGAFSGAGNTLPPTAVSIPGTLLRVPLAYYLAISLKMGPEGVFWAITISSIIKGIALSIWFVKSKWKVGQL